QTHRVWTALAEAHLASDDPKSARTALDRARRREASAAEAAVLLAELQAEQALEEPERAKDALAAHRLAVELNAHVPRYRAALGIYLAHLGELAEAEHVLREVVDMPGLDPNAL